MDKQIFSNRIFGKRIFIFDNQIFGNLEVDASSAGDPLVARGALDHRYCEASCTNPARTGFLSM
jgi:hypothetical protein